MDVEAEGFGGARALHLAAEGGHAEALQALIGARAGAETGHRYGDPPLLGLLGKDMLIACPWLDSFGQPTALQQFSSACTTVQRWCPGWSRLSSRPHCSSSAWAMVQRWCSGCTSLGQPTALQQFSRDDGTAMVPRLDLARPADRVTAVQPGRWCSDGALAGPRSASRPRCSCSAGTMVSDGA